MQICEQMQQLRKMVDEKGIEWHDDSDEFSDKFFIHRTHFNYRGFLWSVINGYGSYGGLDVFTHKQKGLLELMSNAVNGGEPIGWLSAEECMKLIIGEKE